MRSAPLFAFAAGALLVAVSGCSKPCSLVAYDEASGGRAPAQANAGSPSPPSGTTGTTSTTPADASRIISEADVVQLDHEQNYVYAMSRSGSLAVVDASQPGTLRLLGTSVLAGEPFEMFRRGNVLLTLSNFGAGDRGTALYAGTDPQAVPPPTASAVVSAVDVSDPRKMTTLKTLSVPGEIADSRIVGNVLYLATFENAQCYGCAAQARTVVTTFDIADPLAIKQIDQMTFTGPDPSNYPALQGAWKRSIVATAQRLYVGGLPEGASTADQGVIQVLDITDPAGHLVAGARLSTSGPITSRWQMDETAGVLRVISQRGVARTANGEAYPDIDTFRIESSSSIVRIGHATMTLPSQEALKTVRFDGARAYAITNNHVDPLFTIDLSDPTNPAQKGQIELPGWIYYLEPRGDRLIGLGLDRTDTTGNLQLSLFDVADLATPKLLDRTSFGPPSYYTGSDDQILGGVLAEDQDRIQKAFRIFDDGLMAIPFSGGASSTGAACGSGSGIQLVDWTRTSLHKQALLPVSGNPRRAIRRDSGTSQELIAVSDSNVTSFAIDNRASGRLTADVVIGACVPRVIPQSTTNIPNGGDVVGDDFQGVDPAGGWGGDVCH